MFLALQFLFYTDVDEITISFQKKLYGRMYGDCRAPFV
jgi:hypothetical protein